MDPNDDPETTSTATVRGEIGRPRGPRRVSLPVAVTVLLVAAVAVAIVGLALREARTPVVVPSASPSPSPIIVATSDRPSPTVVVSQPLAPSAEPTRVPMSSPPVATTASIPVARGGAQMAPGPDGGLYVLIDAPRGAVTGPPSRAVLALLDAAGKPRPGWPIALTGWSCKDQNSAARVMSTAADGSIRLVCIEDVAAEATGRQVGLAFDPAGQMMPGWPVELPAVEIWGSQPQMVGDELLVLAHKSAGSLGDGAPQPGAWWVISVAVDGTVRQGVRYEVPDISPYKSGAIATDGAVYLLGVRGDSGALTTEIVPLDVNGVRSGWPQTVEGVTSMPTVGPGGRLFFTRTKGQGTSMRTQRLVFERDGRSVGTGSAGLPIAPSVDYTGAGSGLAAPAVAADGTTFLVGEVDGRPPVYALGPTGLRLPGWPYRLDGRSGTQGACSSQDTGCGAWRTVPAVGPDGTLYLLVAAYDRLHGGSIVAIGMDGRVRAGWPVRLPMSASFWSAIVRADGSVQALAVASRSGRDTWTLYRIDSNGTVRQRTPIVTP
jgi:hypothetical protein